MTSATMTAEQLAEGRAKLAALDDARNMPKGPAKDCRYSDAHDDLTMWLWLHAAALLAPKDAEGLLRGTREALGACCAELSNHTHSPLGDHRQSVADVIHQAHRALARIDAHLSATTGGERGGG